MDLLYRKLTQNSPKYLEWNLAEEKLEGFFPLKYKILSFWKMPKLLDFRFPEEWYFLKCDYTELKRSSKINFPVAEQHRWAVVGFKGTNFALERFTLNRPSRTLFTFSRNKTAKTFWKEEHIKNFPQFFLGIKVEGRSHSEYVLGWFYLHAYVNTRETWTHWNQPNAF